MPARFSMLFLMIGLAGTLTGCVRQPDAASEISSPDVPLHSPDLGQDATPVTTIATTPDPPSTAPATTMPTAPVAAQNPQSITTADVTRIDEFHWLRNRDTLSVLAYLNAENAYADIVLAPTKRLQADLIDEFEAHTPLEDDSLPVPRADGWLYFQQLDRSAEYPKYFRRKPTQNDPPQLLLDLNELAKTTDYVELRAFEVSDDGNLLAYAMDRTGRQEHVLSIKDIDSGRLLPDTADRVTSLEWAADGQTLFYITADVASKRPNQVWRLKIGGIPQPVYEEKDAQFRVHLDKTLDRQFIVITSSSVTTSDVRVVPSDQPEAEPHLLAERRENVQLFLEGHRDGQFFIRTNDNGRNFRLIRMTQGNSLREAAELLPHRADIYLEGVYCFKDHIVLAERSGGQPKLSVFDPANKTTQPITLPESAHEVRIGENDLFSTDKFRLVYSSFVTPRTDYEYDLVTRTLTLLKRQSVPGGYDPSRYAQQIIYAPARDGKTSIPISIIRRKDLPSNPAPLLVSALGAYGIPNWITFQPERISLLDRGVTLAVAHVRGGGELGTAWHDAGRAMNKRNTFTDVVDVVTYLQTEGWTTPDRTGVAGVGAGGLAVGVVLNERPNLFKVALLGVPMVDLLNTLTDESAPPTAADMFEWGNPHQRATYNYIRSYSPYENIKPQPYPAMLIFGSYQDAASTYWGPTKYVAKLRALKTDTNPLILSLPITGSSAGASGRTRTFEDKARRYAFVLWQLGIENSLDKRD